ncbi:hypothetical protein NLI96_g12851 [Meripilus lineatus]|uniref:C2H2-type domain-containing protein n=1 Tax=Meripilus lineatus TaxID=2056292 RepID=A0AAD5UTT1_9APHY|nr:hypothetical protein NLI96_g12851 [Physisporinus lineatus]
MNRHMCSLHSVNVEDQSFECPYCHQLCFALFNLNQHIKRHFAQRDNVCCTVLRVQDDDSILVICGYCSTATNDLERHREFHEKDNFYIQSVDSLKTPYHKLAYVKPEDRVAGPTKDDKPKVCPQFNIPSEDLNGPLPACFLPSPEYLEKVKNGLIDPTSTKKRRGRRKATKPAHDQPSPGHISSERYNPPPRSAPLTSPHDLMTAPPTTDHGVNLTYSYNLNPTSCTLPSVNDYPDPFAGVPFPMDAQSHEGITTIPPLDPTTSYLLLQSPASVPTPEESAFYASLFIAPQSSEEMMALPPLTSGFTPFHLNSTDTYLPPQLPASDFSPAAAPEEPVYNATLLNPQYQATSPCAPYLPFQQPSSDFTQAPAAPEETVIDASLFDPRYPATTPIFPTYDSNLSQEVDLHIRQLYQQLEYNQQCDLQYVLQHQEQYDQPQYHWQQYQY